MKRAVAPKPDDSALLSGAEHEAPRTLTEAIYRRLRAHILWGMLEPGAPLRSDELRAAYAVGISPLREALSRLAVERLVVSVGQRGFRVATITAADVSDVMETRLVIERAALANAILKGGLHWETRLVAAHHRLKRVTIPLSAADERAEDWAMHHRAFHMALLSACDSPWQMNLAGLLFDQAERFRLVRVKRGPAQKVTRDTAIEHQEIVEAALARDVDRALRALESHYRATTQEALAQIAQMRAHSND